MANTIKHWIKTCHLVFSFSIKSSLAQKSIWYSTIVFALCLFTLFTFSLGVEVHNRFDVRIGTYWAIQEFICVLTLNHMYESENESHPFDVILAAGLPKSAVLIGKTLFITVLLFSFQLTSSLLWFFLYNIKGNEFISLFSTWIWVAPLFSLGTASLGAFIHGLIAKSNQKGLLIPLLFFPLHTSILLGSVTLCLQSQGTATMAVFNQEAWATILITYPFLFLTLGCMFSSALFKEF